MDASGFASLAIFMVACGQLTCQMVQDASPIPLLPSSSAETTGINNDTTTIATPTSTAVPLNCTTGTGLQGSCVSRQMCDYGTPAIDFSLYAKRGYVRTCMEEEVCCPFEAIVPIEETVHQPIDADDSFDFDEND